MHVVGPRAPGEVSNPAKPAYRVLVIDDDDCVGAAIKVTLARRNGETELASRAYAGIEALESSRFDVVLVDLFMPGMSGLDAISYIRRQSGIPIIAMSGFRLRGLPEFHRLSRHGDAARRVSLHMQALRAATIDRSH